MKSVKMLSVSVLMFVVFIFAGCQKNLENKTDNAVPLSETEVAHSAPAEATANPTEATASTEAAPAPAAAPAAGSVKNAIAVADVFAKKTELNNKEVTVAGKVIKVSTGILGSNWLHIQDGTGDKSTGNHDITVTTKAQPNVGDKVVATGILATDKDFGAGYKYNVIIENAGVTVQ